ncbi:MAG: T9SS type A sorting domain-containing protein, partial [Ignavibacterium sp.]|nr:T9SS type A sorting domain-containing protein [Ignavibacterium sp.]
PNPYNPNTTIRYQIPEACFVTLKLYDCLGNEITTLTNEEQQAGSYRVKFNASLLSSGVYFYRLHAGSFAETKKMVLLR